MSDQKTSWQRIAKESPPPKREDNLFASTREVEGKVKAGEVVTVDLADSLWERRQICDELEVLAE